MTLDNHHAQESSEENIEYHNEKVVLIAMLFMVIALPILLGLMLGPEIPPTNPDIENNINHYTHDELRDLSIKACNQGWSPDSKNPDQFNHPYSHTLELEIKALGETQCP